jgi:hypothetical protein
MKAITIPKCTIITAAILVLASNFASFAQPAKPGPEQQKMHVWLGDWVWEAETRDSPTEAWYKGSWTGQVRLMPGGFFIEFRWKGTVKGTEMTLVEIEGYDPVKKVNVTAFFNSDGTMGNVTSAIYKGSTEEVKYTSIDATGKRLEARCTWNFGADSMSLSGSCEQLTDGKWWLFRRVIKATKTKLAP